MMRRAGRLVVVTSLTALALASAAVPGTGGRAAAAAAAATAAVTSVAALPTNASVAAVSAAGGSGAFSETKTITRTHLVDGKDETRDSRTVTMTVDRTQNLRSRQSVGVTWQGAHPTGNPMGDINSPLGVNDEYPFVLMQCRGVDSTTAPVSERLTPQTCWTQTGPQERFVQTPSTAFPAWRVDRYAEPADRTFHVNDPRPLPPGCNANASYATRRVPFVSVTGTTYYPDGSSCTAQPPESLVVDNASQPGNTTYGITRPDGRGETKFTVWSTQDNASLGCSESVKCALVAIPVMGVSCDVEAASIPAADRPPASTAERVAQDCMSTGVYGPGDVTPKGPSALAASGRLWATASNWRNRITIPLTFAPADDACDVVGGKEPIDLFGSELMTQAMIQWRPVFCLDDKRTPFRHVQVGEPQAANLLAQSSIDAGLVTYGPEGGYTKPVVSAPVAFSGFAVSYAIDDAEGASYTDLRITPRLIAKLLTMSYPGQNFVQKEYDALRSNPLDMSRDPEFQALNPRIRKGVNNSVSASTILSLSSDSDVVRSLTAYINADKEARVWLDGAADPWGMKVNPSYLKIELPAQTWPQSDTFEPKSYYATGINACLQNSPVPYLPLIASPTIRMSNISFALQFANSTSQVNCVEAAAGSTDGLKLVAGGRQNPGFRFVLGITSLGDAARYDLDTAALQTTVAAVPNTKFTSDSGRTFVAPTDDGLREAARLLTPDAKAGVWDLPVARIVNEDGAKAAYPGAMVVHAAVPTLGVPAADAQAYAALLRWAATTGQVSGTTNGTLPQGYLPLTAANGLQTLASYTAEAASAVAAQKGEVPSVVPTSVSGPSPSATPAPTPTSGALGSAGSGGSSGPRASSASGGSSGSGASSGSSGSGVTPDGVAKASSAGPAPAVPTTVPPTAKPVPGSVAPKAMAPVRTATVAQDVGRAGAMVLILFLAALALAGAIPLAHVLRRLRGRRG